MKKKLLAGLMSLCMLACLLPVSALAVAADCSSWDSCDHAAYIEDTPGVHYSTIQEAITDAGAGDTVVVKAGEHNEQLTISGKTNLTLRGEEGAIIKPDTVSAISGMYPVVSVSGGSNITISNLTINGETAAATPALLSSSNWYLGILINTARDVNIDSCIVTKIDTSTTRGNIEYYKDCAIAAIQNGPVNIINTTISDFGTTGVNPGTATDYEGARVNLTDCTIIGQGTDAEAVQNGVTTKQHMTIENCEFRNLQWKDANNYNDNMGGFVNAYAITTANPASDNEFTPQIVLREVTCEKVLASVYMSCGKAFIESGTYVGGVQAASTQYSTGQLEIKGGTFTQVQNEGTDANGNPIVLTRKINGATTDVTITEEAFEGVAAFDYPVGEYVVPDYIEAYNKGTGLYTYHSSKPAAQKAAGANGFITIPADGEWEVALVYENGVHPTEYTNVNDNHIFTLPTATRPDHIFRGWSSGNETYQPGDQVTITANTTFTAQWEAITLSISPSAETLKGGGEVTLTVATNLTGTDANAITLTDNNGTPYTLTANGNGTYGTTVTLPNADATYTFTAAYGTISDSCTVTATYVAPPAGPDTDTGADTNTGADTGADAQQTPGAVQTGDSSSVQIFVLIAAAALAAGVTVIVIRKRRSI